MCAGGVAVCRQWGDGQILCTHGMLDETPFVCSLGGQNMLPTLPSSPVWNNCNLHRLWIHFMVFKRGEGGDGGSGGEAKKHTRGG